MDVLADLVDAPTADGPMAVLRKRPAGAAPTVVIFHDGPGIRGATHTFAEKLTAEGYQVLVPDLYHRHGRMIGYEPAERAADPSLGKRMGELLASVRDDDVQADLDAALAACGVGDDAGPLGVIGFCMGARHVYRTLQRLPDRFAAGAMWHPSFLSDDRPDSPHLTAGSLAQPLFIGIGDADQVQSIAMHQRFFDAVAPLDHVTVDVFPGADHGYSWPDHPTYDANAATRSFAATTALFASTLR